MYLDAVADVLQRAKLKAVVDESQKEHLDAVDGWAQAPRRRSDREPAGAAMTRALYVLTGFAILVALIGMTGAYTLTENEQPSSRASVSRRASRSPSPESTSRCRLRTR